MLAALQQLLDRFHARKPIRAGSLIVTVFGDAVLPRGGSLALSSLITIMAAFRINQGLVRTALSRLVNDGLFERTRIGRNSFYRLTAPGQQTFAAATDRIYGNPVRPWSGGFDLLLLENGEARSARRTAVKTLGYGELAPNLMLRPAASGDSSRTGPDLHLTVTATDPETLRRVAALAWPIDDIEARYRAFLDHFAAAAEAADSGTTLPDLEALVLRILLVHEYRRVILRDPLLPPELLPRPWAGSEAWRLCGRLYQRLVPQAERWLDRNAEDDRGPLPGRDAAFGRRFADLPP